MKNLQDHIATDPDYHICRIFLQFEKYGAVINFDAYILEDLGYLTSEERRIPPFLDPVTLYEMTPKVHQEKAKFREDWVNIYVPKYKLKSDVIPDLYSTKDAEDHFWALSVKRLNQERNRGRLSQAVNRSI